MTLELPPELRWLGWIAGTAWPDGDEDAMWALSDAWKAAAQALSALEPDVVTAKSDTEKAYPAGAGADSMGAKFDDLIDGEHSVKTLAEMLQEVADSTFDMGTQLQATKLTIILSLAWLAAEIIWAWTFPPTAPAVEAGAIATTRSVLKIIEDYVQNFIERMAQRLGASAMKERYYFKELLSGGRLIMPSAKGFGVYTVKILEGAATSALMDGAVQVGQIAAGKRHSFDWKEFGVSMAASAAGSIPGREVARYMGFGMDKYLGSSLAKMNIPLGKGIAYPAGAVIRGASIGAVSGATSSLFGNMVAAAAYGPGAFGSPMGWVGGISRGAIVGAARGTFIKRTVPTTDDLRYSVWMKNQATNKVKRTDRPNPNAGNTTTSDNTTGGNTRPGGNPTAGNTTTGGNTRPGGNTTTGGNTITGGNTTRNTGSRTETTAADSSQIIAKPTNRAAPQSDSGINGGSGPMEMRPSGSSRGGGDSQLASSSGPRGTGGPEDGSSTVIRPVANSSQLGASSGPQRGFPVDSRSQGTTLGGGRGNPDLFPAPTSRRGGQPSLTAGLGGRSELSSGLGGGRSEITSGLRGGRSEITSGLGSGKSELTSGLGGGRSEITPGLGGGKSELTPGSGGGKSGLTTGLGGGKYGGSALGESSHLLGGRSNARGEVIGDGSANNTGMRGRSLGTEAGRGGDDDNLSIRSAPGALGVGSEPGTPRPFRTGTGDDDSLFSSGSMRGRSSDDDSLYAAPPNRGGGVDHAAPQAPPRNPARNQPPPVPPRNPNRAVGVPVPPPVPPRNPNRPVGVPVPPPVPPRNPNRPVGAPVPPPIPPRNPNRPGPGAGGAPVAAAAPKRDDDFLGKSTDMKAKTRPKREPEWRELPGPYEAPAAPGSDTWLDGASGSAGPGATGPAGASGPGATGATGSGASGSGDNPFGDNPFGDNPGGTNPEGTNPEGTNPEGTNPEGTNPQGTDPGASGSSGPSNVDVAFKL